jgi:hypothetical protein
MKIVVTKDAVHDLSFRHGPEMLGGHPSYLLRFLMQIKQLVKVIHVADKIPWLRDVVKSKFQVVSQSPGQNIRDLARLIVLAPMLISYRLDTSGNRLPSRLEANIR